MNKSICIWICIVLVTLSRKHIYAQKPLEQTPFADENIDDLGNVSDEFQVLFFQALKQKGIQNYDRAVTALNKAIELEPKEAILFFERGKNHVFLKKYDRAINDFKAALELRPADPDVLKVLYDVYYHQRNYVEAKKVVLQLLKYDSQYKEDLARLYTQTKRYDEALDLLDQLEKEQGPDIYREQLKNRLYMLSGNTDRQMAEIKENIAASPQQADEYLKLIFLYSEQGNTQKAYETALELQKIHPEADQVQLALYKFYLTDGKTDLAVAAMQKVLQSKRIDTTAKHSVLNDFLLFVNKNPQYQTQLENAIAVFDTQVGSSNIFEELANYYLKKDEKGKALPYLQKALESDPENLDLIKNVVLLQLDAAAYKEVQAILAQALELYPSQPLLYLTYGVALNKQAMYDKAITALETGIDYIIDNLQMEIDFYKQLGDSYTGKNDGVKAKRYYDKVSSLKEQL